LCYQETWRFRDKNFFACSVFVLMSWIQVSYDSLNIYLGSRIVLEVRKKEGRLTSPHVVGGKTVGIFVTVLFCPK
jgi:hypothetical protein